MGELFRRVKNWFDEQNWPYREGDGLLLTNVTGRNGQWPCGAQAHDDGLVAFYSVFPEEYPPEVNAALAEATTRANCGLATGAFELDLDGGGIRFRTSIDLGGNRDLLTDDLIKTLVLRNVSTMDRYLPALRAVVGGGAAADAIRAVEAG